MSQPLKDDKPKRITSRASRKKVSKARNRIVSKLDQGKISKKKAAKRLTRRIENTTRKETDRIGGGRNTSERVRNELISRLINSAKRRYGRG
tara:strand:- start:172 stop:447 length:276 start_codon:yes stop_codon:yes gene_type:complete